MKKPVIHNLTKIGDIDARLVSRRTFDFLKTHAIEYKDTVTKEDLINIHDEELLLKRYNPTVTVKREIKHLIKIASLLDVAYIRLVYS